MNRKTKILIGVLAIFIVGMTLGVAFSEPVDAKTFKINGWKYKVSDKAWKKMKKQAKKSYKRNKKNAGGGWVVGYSTKCVKVKLHKKGHKSYKSAFYCRYTPYGPTPYLSTPPI